MSGIVGLLDPDGARPASIAKAAGSASYRGVPDVVPLSDTIAIATLARPGEPRLTASAEHSSLAMDGRVDALLAPRASSARGCPGHEVLHEALARRGPDALNDFAAEFAVALVRPAEGHVTLARDVFGLHPLYMAWRGRRFAFASDPAVLVALGLASGELDEYVVASYLGRNEPLDGRTAFRGVVELLPGAWLRVDSDGRRSGGRWFDPGRLQGPRLRGADAIDAVREAVTRAVCSRAGGGRIGVLLSGGVDSGSVTVAGARAGLQMTAITQDFDRDLPVNEGHLARSLADREGIAWLPAPVPSDPTWEDLEVLPKWCGTPLGPFAFPQAVAPVDTAVDAGVEVLMTGEGGEPLFTASDVAVLDLLRSGRPLSARRAAREFHTHWGYSYGRMLKVAGRAISPRGLLRARERSRPVAPWVRDRVSNAFVEETAPRSDRAALLLSLTSPHPAGFDLDERLGQTRGLRFAYPLLDLRVVRTALSLGLTERAPIDRPKPVLSAAFLDELASSRVKMSFLPYYDRLARRLQESFPVLFSPASLASREGLIDGTGLRHVGDDRWRVDSLGIAVLEMWLRERL